MTICNIERIQCRLFHSQSGLFCAVSVSCPFDQQTPWLQLYYVIFPPASSCPNKRNQGKDLVPVWFILN